MGGAGGGGADALIFQQGFSRGASELFSAWRGDVLVSHACTAQREIEGTEQRFAPAAMFLGREEGGEMWLF